MNTLLVGCSFVQSLNTLNFPNTKLLGSAGAGNQAIAAMALHELSIEHYDKVIILWSGINRIDIPVGIDLHKTLAKYPYYNIIDNTVWYHSGGVGASYDHYPAPSKIKNIMHTQYLGATSQYLTDLSLLSIISTQSFLEANDIQYKMSFIYDIHNKKYNNNWLNSVLGTIDTSSPLYKLVKWEKFSQVTPIYDWAHSHNLLTDDKFHPSDEGMIKWLEQIN